jgi:hypothetical protein
MQRKRKKNDAVPNSIATIDQRQPMHVREHQALALLARCGRPWPGSHAAAGPSAKRVRRRIHRSRSVTCTNRFLKPCSFSKKALCRAAIKGPDQEHAVLILDQPPFAMTRNFAYLLPFCARRRSSARRYSPP